MSKDLPKLTFGFVNCNRLHYLKSCVESFLHCTDDYPNKELIIVDNASIEEGTDAYLLEKEKQGFTIIRQQHRDFSNEFAKALNIIAKESTGDFVTPMQGDVQFVIKSKWLHKFVEFYLKHYDNIGSIYLDAQRNIRNRQQAPFGIVEELKQNDYNFLFDLKRNPIAGAGDVMYSRKILDLILPWDENNEKHEGGPDSETKMLTKVQELIKTNNLTLYAAAAFIPPAAAIITDPRGTNARVRGNRRYGKYFPPHKNFTYYKIHEYDDLVLKHDTTKMPAGLEDIVETIGFKKPIDVQGNWLKNPINPDTATKDDYIELDPALVVNEQVSNVTSDINVSDKDLDDWLET